MFGISWMWFAGGAVLAAAGAIAVLYNSAPLRRRRQAAEFDRAGHDFATDRKRLEARFFEAAAASGRPRDLRWVRCDFGQDVAFARDRKTGDLAAFLVLTVGFEAVEGGAMEDVEAVGRLRLATAVFVRRQGRWETDGRTIFNLEPAEAIARFVDQLEPIT